MAEWWYANGQHKHGPHAQEELKRLLQLDTISPDTMVWREGLEEWIPAKEDPELSALLKAMPPPLPPAMVKPVLSGQPGASSLVTRPVDIAASAATDKETRINVAPVAATAWRRFLARVFDIWTMSLATVGIFLSCALIMPNAFGWLDNPSALGLIALLLLPVSLLVDATVYALCGNTPGKALLRLEVVSTEGDRLGFGEYLMRNVSVWCSGLCFGLPLFSLLTMWYQSRRLAKAEAASYDANAYRVQQRGVGPGRWLAFVVLFGVLAVIHALFSAIGEHLEGTSRSASGGKASADAGESIPASSPRKADASPPPVATSDPCLKHYYLEQAPIIKNQKLASRATPLCYEGASVMYSGVTRTPLWSAEHLTVAKLEAAAALDFVPSTSIEQRLPPSYRTTGNDFDVTGYDIIPLTSPNRLATVYARIDGSTFANVVPVYKGGIARRWARMGESMAARVQQGGDVYTISGATFLGAELRKLHSGVLVPTHLFLAFYDVKSKEGGAYFVETEGDSKSVAVSLKELDAISGINLFPSVPDAIKAKIPRLTPP